MRGKDFAKAGHRPSGIVGRGVEADMYVECMYGEEIAPPLAVCFCAV
jgi:hypothetical protein